MRSIEIIKSTMILQMKNTFVRPMFRFCLLVNPIINTILMYEMFINSKNQDLTSYVILGSGLMGLWTCICFSSAGDINRERANGTLPLIFVSPADFGLIITGKIFGNTLLSLLSIVISFLTAIILFRIKISIAFPLCFLIAFISTVICFVIVSMFIAYLLTLSRKTQLYMNCIEIPILILCGFVFPVELLPTYVQYLSNILAPTWAIRLLRMSISGTTIEAFTYTLLTLVIIMGIYAFLAHVLHLIIEKQVRVKATLEVL